MEKANRLTAFDTFSTGLSKILITTNMLSHGIDVRTVQLIVNFTMPAHSKEFLFRATRGGRQGILIILLLIIENLNLRFYVKLLLLVILIFSFQVEIVP